MNEIRVRITDEEQRAGALLEETAQATMARFAQYGCVVLENVFPVAFIDHLHETYLEMYGHMSSADMLKESFVEPSRFLEVGSNRFDIAISMQPPFSSWGLLASSLLRPMLQRLLDDHRMNSFTIVTSHPGSLAQHVHRDSGHLFKQGNVSVWLPPYAVNIAVPLVDVDLATGPTGVWPGSHRWAHANAAQDDLVIPTLARGDCMMMDYRTLHSGMPNTSTRVRPIIYMVYARPWFTDDCNHMKRNPLDMPPEVYMGLAPELKQLLARAWTARMRTLDAACPCGSTRPFSGCHGANDNPVPTGLARVLMQS